METEAMNKGLLMVNTGNGKGKTTAALGQTFRALGHGKKICIIQFIKGNWKYGELFSVERYMDLVDFYVMGNDFDLHVLITGRYAPKKLIETADLVTDMQEVKHPYQNGILAQKGIEF